ncbi:hypothetical protein NDU88_003824 [Pleurodeles waltl]|uniref:Uncharacterized protein n=1 Tax=Pleurodeles waltl TaxID=8319 RepID=A0AAV7MZP6_PLEWA|nr:hypothetical protein NDU88_003824 [Pleurodeles waltl]
MLIVFGLAELQNRVRSDYHGPVVECWSANSQTGKCEGWELLHGDWPSGGDGLASKQQQVRRINMALNVPRCSWGRADAGANEQRQLPLPLDTIASTGLNQAVKPRGSRSDKGSSQAEGSCTEVGLNNTREGGGQYDFAFSEEPAARNDWFRDTDDSSSPPEEDSNRSYSTSTAGYVKRFVKKGRRELALKSQEKEKVHKRDAMGLYINSANLRKL